VTPGEGGGPGAEGSFELDRDTSLERGAKGHYRGAVSDGWRVGGGPNGGYLAAICLRAVLGESPFPDPVTMTVHFLERPAIAACEVEVTALRLGRGHASFRAELSQDGVVRCAALATLGRWREPGPLDFQPEPPEVPAPSASLAVRRVGEGATLWDRLDTRAARRDDLFMFRTEPGEAVTGGWIRLRDGRPTDALAVALFLDSWPPAVFGRTLEADPLGAPTIEYTVHWRRRPSSDWCYGRFETRTLSGGYADEQGELYDDAGHLVAESRQLARYLGGRSPAR